MVKQARISRFIAVVVMIATPVTLGVYFPLPLPLLAQTSPEAEGLPTNPRDRFPFLATVPNGTTVNIDGSESMVVVNDRLGRGFEADYAGTRVEVASQGIPAAIDALLKGEIDLVALGRQLTQEERAQGLVQVTLKRDKIAVIVGPDNPFKASLTLNQFAQIFRGEITDWSELGGEPGPIRFVDRPADSDVRLAFREYQPFTTAPFVSGDNAVVVETDETNAVIAELGRDGISYAPAQQVIGLDTVNVLPMHSTLPTNRAYPYSQARAYVYQNPPSEAAAAFLGYGLATPGQTAVISAQQAEADAIASGFPISSAVPQPIGTPSPLPPDSTNNTNSNSNGEAPPENETPENGTAQNLSDGNDPNTTAATPDPGEPETQSKQPSSSGESGDSPSEQSLNPQSPNAQSPDVQSPNSTTNPLPVWLWWILPAGILALVLVMLGRDRPSRTAIVSSETTPHPSEPSSSSGGDTYQPIPVTQVETPTDTLVRLEQETTQNPDGADSWILQGHTLAQLQRYEEAIASYDRALTITPTTNPNTVAALTGKGNVCLANGTPHEAIAHLKEAEQQSPDDPLIHLYQGYSFIALQQSPEALFAYDQSITFEASNPDAIVAKGTTLLALEQPEEAIVCFNHIIDEEVTASDFLHRRSQTLGLPLHPPNTLMANALKGKGKALLTLGYTGAALNNFQQAVDTDPKNPALWISRGNALLTAQQGGEAIASFDQALTLNPNDPEALAGKATAMATV